jgi:predicted Holliday junction resolvase-like endonuclease
MKKLFVVIVTDVERINHSSLYYIKAISEIAAKEKARELVVEGLDFGYDEEDLDEWFDFKIRELRENDVIEA